MAAPPNLNLPDGFPAWAQTLYVGAFVLIAAMLGAGHYFLRLFRGKAEPEGKHVVLEAASLADMSDFHRLTDRVDSMAADTKAIRTLLEEQAEAKEDDARIQMIVEKAMERNSRSRPIRRRRKPSAGRE